MNDGTQNKREERNEEKRKIFVCAQMFNRSFLSQAEIDEIFVESRESAIQQPTI